jgi:DNA-binding GntR family transcriptional regulator
MTTQDKKRKATRNSSLNHRQVVGNHSAESRASTGKLAALSPGRNAERFLPTDDEIYAQIHEAVLDHRLPPGIKLKEVALAELFGVTRGTIRKVLSRLAHVKLVDLRPNRGAVVASPSPEESRDLFAARRALEGAIVEALTPKITKQQIKELRALVKQEQDTYRRGDVRSALKLSVRFHSVLAAMAGNTVLAELLDQLISRTPLVVLAYKGPSHQTSCSNDEHSVLLDAIAAGDPDKAVAVMKEHLIALESQLNLQRQERPADLAEILGVTRDQAAA